MMSVSRKRSRKDHDLLPTKDEQLHLRETENLMRSNFSSLQVDELLKEVCSDKQDHSSKVNKVSNWISRLRDFIKSIEPKKYITAESLGDLGTPGIKMENYHHKPISLNFIPPTELTVIGSFALHTTTLPFLNIDISLRIPDECVDGSRDILNHIYFDKRKLYLAVIARELFESVDLIATNDGLWLSLLKGDDRKPILLLRPNFKTKYTIRLIPTVSSKIFNLRRLAASKNNVRPRHWMESLRRDDTDEAQLDAMSLLPTVDYNMAVLEDMVIAVQYKILSQTVAVKAYRDTIILLKVWLTQLGLRVGADSLDGHLAGILVSYLVHTHRLSPQMSPLSAFQAVLKFLADTDLSRTSLDFSQSSPAVRPLEDDSSGRTTSAVLWHPIQSDSSEAYNAFWRVSAASCAELRREAGYALRRLQGSDGGVAAVLLHQRSFFERSDLFVRVPMDLSVSGSEAAVETTRWQWTVKRAVDLLQRGLGDRAVAVACFGVSPARRIQEGKDSHYRMDIGTGGGAADASSNPSVSSITAASAHFPCWPVSSQPPGPDDWEVVIGVKMSSDEAALRRRVDRGPPTEDSDAVAAFRSLWGSSLCQLRRFRDGNIVEAVVWPKDLQGAELIAHIATVLLTNHLAVASSSVCIVSTADLERWLPGPEGDGAPVGIVAQCSDAAQALDSLRSLLISGEISGLPLPVEALTPACSELRYTCLLPPQAHPLVAADNQTLRIWAGQRVTKVVRRLSVVLTLQKSSSWPEDQEALRHTRLAVMIRIGERLKELYKLRSAVHKDGSLDLFYRGYIFHIQIGEDSTPAAAASAVPSSPESPITLSRLQKHHTMIHAIAVQFHCYADTVRLLSMWLACHSYSGHIIHEALELLVAGVFLDEGSVSPLSSSYQGFLRSLQKLASWDWDTQPLILDVGRVLGGEPLGSAERVRIQQGFQAAREARQGGSMWFVTPLDVFQASEGAEVVVRSEFTRAVPERVALSKIRKDAALAVQQLFGWASGGGVDLSRQLWSAEQTPVWNVEFRVLKSLRPLPASSHIENGAEIWDAFVRGPSAAHVTVYSNIAPSELTGHGLTVGDGPDVFCPVQSKLVNSLRDKFGHAALFFWNHMRGDRIGLVWRPTLFLPAKFSVKDCSGRLPIVGLSDKANSGGSTSALTIVNVAGLIAEMVSLSDGLIYDTIFH